MTLSRQKRMMKFGPQAKLIDALSRLTMDPLENERAQLLQNKTAILQRLIKEKELFILASNGFALLEKKNNAQKTEQAIEEINAAIVISRINPDSYGLDCSNAMLTRVPNLLLNEPGWQEYWKSLLSINLANNFLTALPEGMKVFTALRELNLSNNQFSVFPQNVRFLIKLNILHLERNKLKEITAEIGELTALNRLYLHNNEITLLSPEMARLTQVVVLDLSSNMLTMIPPQVTRMAGLSQLWLKNNQLENLTPQICKLGSLVTLDVSYNRLAILPSDIGKCDSVKQLILEGNPLPYEIIELADKNKIEDLKKLYRSSAPLPTAVERPLSTEQQDRLKRLNINFQVGNGIKQPTIMPLAPDPYQGPAGAAPVPAPAPHLYQGPAAAAKPVLGLPINGEKKVAALVHRFNAIPTYKDILINNPALDNVTKKGFRKK